jgi:hypothetical protein
VDDIYVYPQNEEEKYKMIYTFEDITEDHTIHAIIRSKYSGISDHTKTFSFTLLPNPANNYVEIINDLQLQGEMVQLYDSKGCLLKSVSIQDEKTKIDISNFAKGLYLVKIGNESQKLIIQ